MGTLAVVILSAWIAVALLSVYTLMRGPRGGRGHVWLCVIVLSMSVLNAMGAWVQITNGTG